MKQQVGSFRLETIERGGGGLIAATERAEVERSSRDFKISLKIQQVDGTPPIEKYVEKRWNIAVDNTIS